MAKTRKKFGKIIPGYHTEKLELKGYDSYTVTLGDKLRGERATLGKTLEDVERETRLRIEFLLGIENADISKGRFVNQSDINEGKKVAVIGNKVSMDLFKTENPIDEYISIFGISFKVVGVYRDPGGEREETRIFIPITTAQRVYNAGENIRLMSFTLVPEENFEKSLAASELFTAQLESDLKTKHIVSPTDTSAIEINNSLENAKRFFAASVSHVHYRTAKI